MRILAAIGACALAHRAPAHRPIGVLLVAVLAVDVVRAGLPARAHLALLLAVPALSVWSTFRVLAWRRVGIWCAAAWALCAAALVWTAYDPRVPKAAAWWDLAWQVPFGACCALEIGVWLWWRRRSVGSTISQRVAAALVGGDLVAFASCVVAGWERVGWQAEAVGAVVAFLQLRWILQSPTPVIFPDGSGGRYRRRHGDPGPDHT